MMRKNRLFYLIIVVIISVLFTYIGIDIIIKFQFLLRDISKHITENVMIVLFFSIFISITGYLSISFNRRLLKKQKRLIDHKILDELQTNKTDLSTNSWYVYRLFSLLLITFGFYLLVWPIQQDFPIEKLPTGWIVYLITLIIIAVGALLYKDTLNIKRLHQQSNNL